MTTPSLSLDEEDLLSMPESDYMNEAQLAFFRERLLTLRRDLMSNVSETVAHLQAGEGLAEADPNDRATTEEEHAIELRIRDRERKLLQRIDAALARIDDGRYGYCDETGEPIGLRRLLARPTASLSVEAQERREFRQRTEKD
jgi:DnaK suppressor protein